MFNKATYVSQTNLQKVTDKFLHTFHFLSLLILPTSYVQLRHYINSLRIGTTNGRADWSEEVRAQHPEKFSDLIAAFQ